MSDVDAIDFDLNKKQTIMFVATTPFAVNAFLVNHLIALSNIYKVILCTNLEAYELLPSLKGRVEILNVPFVRKTSFWADLKCLLQLTAIAIKFKPSTMHSITPKAGLLAMMAGTIGGVPNRWHTFTGQVWATRRSFARCMLKSLDRLIVLLSTQVFADSASQCRFLYNEGVVSKGSLGMLGSGSIAGVDIASFSPEACNYERVRNEFGTKPNVCVYLFVGRLTRDKGVFDLVQSFQKVASMIDNVELWVVGPDDEGFLHKLKDEALGCDAPIRWFGATHRPQRFMAAADILLLPSYREGFGSVVIEAAACGISTIAYRIDGVIDAVEDGHSGILVDVGQKVEFAAAMMSLALNKELRLCLGRQARARATRNFCSNLVTLAWLDFYRSQLND